ncbi:hypothetical protein [Actinoallomurus soli]|uniref:hypothetical protein n=1 Tax=Actinoallomurus soli TaxID=2952535 RepID=UPI002092CCB9|nr:hypothetical protein [Actinoallomurus soli]MCO5967138.1 hypothetical protein [Actinoallomurus soli]
MTAYPPAPATVRPPTAQSPGQGVPLQQPNPAYVELFAAYERAYASAHSLEAALDPPIRTVGDAWVGPAARGWQRELETERGRLKKAAAQILWDIYDALSKVPPYLPK